MAESASMCCFAMHLAPLHLRSSTDHLPPPAGSTDTWHLPGGVYCPCTTAVAVAAAAPLPQYERSANPTTDQSEGYVVINKRISAAVHEKIVVCTSYATSRVLADSTSLGASNVVQYEWRRGACRAERRRGEVTCMI